MNNNKPKPTPAKKKSTPTKPLTPAKKAGGGKRRPALDRFTKKARKEAKALKKNPPTRAMLESFVKEALNDGMPRMEAIIFNYVSRKCLNGNLEVPKMEAIIDLVDLMSRQGKLVLDGSGRYQLPEEEAPPTTPSGRGEVITADTTQDKTGGAPNLDKERFWAYWTRQLILDGLDKDGSVIFGSLLLQDLDDLCQKHKVDRLSKEDFRGIVLEMIDDGEVSIDDPSFVFGTRLRPGPKVKTRGSKMPTRLQRTIDRERYAMRKAIDEGKQEHLAAIRLRTRDAITPDLVMQTLTPVSDALGDLLAFPNEWPQEATLSLDFVLPSGLETAFDRIFGEKPIYTLRWTLVRPVIVGRIVEDVLLECRSESALGCAQHFLAHAEHFVHYGAQRASNKKEVKALVSLKADVLGACSEAAKTLQGAVLDNALRFFR